MKSEVAAKNLKKAAELLLVETEEFKDNNLAANAFLELLLDLHSRSEGAKEFNVFLLRELSQPLISTSRRSEWQSREIFSEFWELATDLILSQMYITGEELQQSSQPTNNNTGDLITIGEEIGSKPTKFDNLILEIDEEDEDLDSEEYEKKAMEGYKSMMEGDAEKMVEETAEVEDDKAGDEGQVSRKEVPGGSHQQPQREVFSSIYYNKSDVLHRFIAELVLSLMTTDYYFVDTGVSLSHLDQHISRVEAQNQQRSDSERIEGKEEEIESNDEDNGPKTAENAIDDAEEDGDEDDRFDDYKEEDDIVESDWTLPKIPRTFSPISMARTPSRATRTQNLKLSPYSTF